VNALDRDLDAAVTDVRAMSSLEGDDEKHAKYLPNPQ
jgi:hypothetical protein